METAKIAYRVKVRHRGVFIVKDQDKIQKWIKLAKANNKTIKIKKVER